MPRNVQAEWIAQQLSRAVKAYRDDDREAVLPLIDDVLARYYDDTAALELGARLARGLGDHPRRIRYLATAFALDPTRSSRRLALGTALLEGGLHEAALDVVEPVLQTQPDSRPALRLKLDALLATGDEAALDGLLETLATEHAEDKSLVLWVATELRDEGERQKAIEWLGRPWVFSTDVKFELRRARLLYEARRYDEADEAFERSFNAATSDAHRAEALLFRGRIARNRGNLDQYLRRLENVLDFDPGNGEAAAALVQDLLRQGDSEAALAISRRHEAAAPHSQALVWIRSLIALSSGQDEEAIGLFRAAIAASEHTLEHYWRLADLLLDLRRPAEACEVLKSAADLAPDSLRVFSRRIRVQHLLNRPTEETLEICNAFLSIHPRDQNALLQKANLLARLGRRNEALAEYRAGARLFPHNVNFWRSGTRLAVNLTKHEEARALARSARQVFGRGSAEDLASYAEVAEAAGQVDDAIAALTTALELDAAHVRARELMARLHRTAGDYRTAWEHILELQGNPARSYETVAMLARTAGALSVASRSSDVGGAQGARPQFPDVMFAPLVHHLGGVRPQNDKLVFHVSSSLASGGAERQVALTVARLAAIREAEPVELIVDDLDSRHGRDFFLSELDEAGVPIHVLRELSATGPWRDLLAIDPTQRQAVRSLAALPDDLRRLSLGLFVLFRNRRPRVVHLWQDMIAVAGGLAAVLAGVPRVILGVRSTRPIEHQRARPYFWSAYRALLQRDGVDMVANSAHGARDYEAWLHLDRGQVAVVHNGFDFARMRMRTSDHEAAVIRRQLNIPPGAPVLGGVMRCSFEKRPSLWLKVATLLASRHDDLFAILVGDGPMRDDLQRTIADLGLAHRIRLVGRQHPVEPWLETMSMVLLSSETEGLPNVLLEAQGLGTPVATVKVGGAPEAVEHDRSGLVIDTSNAEELTSRIEPMLFDDAQLAAFGRAGRAFATQQFSIDATVKQLLALYRS